MGNYWTFVLVGFSALVVYSALNFSKHQEDIQKGVFASGGGIIDVLIHYFKRRSFAYFWSILSIFFLPFIAELEYLKSFVPNAESGSAAIAGIVVIIQVSVKDVADIINKKKYSRSPK